MKPQDYKAKQVIHTPTNCLFTVVGGKRKGHSWFLKDDRGNLFPIEECQLFDPNQLDFDLRSLKSVNSLKDLNRYFKARDPARFQRAWAELEKDPVEAALIAIFYCDNWADFESMCEGYGVKSWQSEALSNRLRDRVKANPSLSKLVNEWYNNAAA